MEHSEPLKFGHDPDVFSKRRISSILKAPRTSMKASGADQDEHQDETKPLEKRRNSRRVSFATTNNVHVFTEDRKNESPGLALIQNLTGVWVTDVQDKMENHFITGLDTMLSKPFHILQPNKENFFSDPVLQDECVDRTLLLGEDTGYMDMTHSHTITIDKEMGINSLNVLENVTGLCNVKNQNGVPSKTISHMEKAVHAEFNDFLASIAKPGAQNLEASAVKNPDLFCIKDTTEEMDKENVIPPHISMQVARCPVIPPPSVLQPRSSEATLLEQDHMDLTKCHTVVIDKGGVPRYSPYVIYGNHEATKLVFLNDSDDMEITQNQTATINLKTNGNVSCCIPLDVDHNRSNIASDDTRGIVMDGYLQEHEANKKAAMDVFCESHAISSFNQPGSRHTSDENTVHPFQNNLSFDAITVSEDMEITQSQTVVLETKCKGEPYSKMRKISSSYRTDDGDRVEIASKPIKQKTDRYVSTVSKLLENKNNVTAPECTLFPNDQNASMELTCQASMFICPDDMELTACNNLTVESGNILPTREISRQRTLFMEPQSVSGDTEKTDDVQSVLSVPYMADDMEITQCQTVVLESKQNVEHNPLSKSRTRMSLLPASCGHEFGNQKQKEMAHKLTQHATSDQNTESCEVSVPKKQELTDCREIYEKSGREMSVIQDDMELTGCKTITIDTKYNPFTSLSLLGLKTPSMPAVLDKDQISLMEVVSEKPGTILQSTDCKPPTLAVAMDPGNLADSRNKSYLADSVLDKDPVCLDVPNSCEGPSHNNLKESSSFNFIAENVESSEKNDGMEITQTCNITLEQQCYIEFKQEDPIKVNAEALSGISDQIKFQEDEHTLTTNKTVPSVLSECVANDSEFIAKRKQSNSDMRRPSSLADLQEKIQNLAQSMKEPNGLLMGSYTAPVPNVTVSEECLVHERMERPDSTEHLKESPPLKNVTSPNFEGFTPFNLKNCLTRYSLGAVTPKLPSRAKLVCPNQTMPIISNRSESLNQEVEFDFNIQNSNDIIGMIDNEVFPDEDLSDMMLSNEQEFSAVSSSDKVTTEDDASQREKVACEIRDADDGKEGEASEKSWDNNPTATGIQNASSLLTKMMDDTSNNGSSIHMKCEAISESTLRNSQFDSQIDGSVDHEFDFYKTLEDGSLRVNELLSHFGINSVIHKSRPSALPDNFKVAQTHKLEDLLRERYIYRPKQKVYEVDCQKLTEIADGFKTQMAEQYKLLRDVNGTLLQDMCAFSNVQLQQFGTKLKEQRAFFRKRSKALSHEMKKVLYSELLKTAQESKQNLVTKIMETDEMLKDLDGCVYGLECELAEMNSIHLGDSLVGNEPALKMKQQDLDDLNSKLAETEKHICELEHQRLALVDTMEKIKVEASKINSHITTLNRLNEWQFFERDESGIVFAFLHNTVHLEIKLKNATENKGISEDIEQDVDISFKFLLNGNHSQPYAGMIHDLLAEYIQAQKQKQMQKYPTSQHIPVLLHDVSLVVSRLRLLGEEIHQLKKWGGLRLGILKITCMDKLVEIVFSSVKASVKFELSLAVTLDYPFSCLQMKKFQNHIGTTRADQIENILTSVVPSKNYLTKVVKRIHSELMS
ncbi:kinetochore scaffold 1 isoform X2 [Hoplias malabaricus]|uniref:kinetochore scaffold 1 isoform X2 n=1 Tax=Hoplias malabaricus TaxID=27720 RepID=UPI003462DF12